DILSTLQQDRQVDVTELAQRFGVSGMTIRRDLAELDEAGQLQRVHGGAIIRRAPAYGSRASTRAPEKAAIAVREGGSRVIVLGGLLTPELSLVNPGTAQEPPQVHLDLLILGCGGLSVDRGITYFDPTEVEVRRLLAGLTDRVVVAADHTKFDRKKAMVLGPLDLIDVLVTDQAPPEPLRTALAAADVEVVIAA